MLNDDYTVLFEEGRIPVNAELYVVADGTILTVNGCEEADGMVLTDYLA